MKLFYVPATQMGDTLPEEESKHCVRVLRMTSGDTLHITDGQGNLYTCRITDPDPRACRIKIIDREFTPESRTIAIACAPTKNSERFEWFLEKATELGVTEVRPLLTERCERRSVNQQRAERVVTSAMKQSLRRWRPHLCDLTPVTDLITQPFGGLKLIAHCGEGERRYLPDILQRDTNVLILIGPEGDFSPAEIDLAIRHGFIPISLGTQRLRTETAALAATVFATAAFPPTPTPSPRRG